MTSETRNILLNATRKLIDKEGIDSISMRTVGSLAGLSRTAMYRHFENKESLLAAIVVENFITLGDLIKNLKSDTKNARQLLFDLFIEYYNFGINNPDHYQLMFNTYWDEKKYPELRQAALGIFEKVAYLVSRAIQTRSSDPGIPLEKTAILYAFIHGLVELHLAGHNEISKGLNDITSLVNHMMDAILKK
jgi:AcrR family transcriptional regulator